MLPANNRMSDSGYVVEASASKVVVKASHVGLQDALVAMGFEYRNDESGTYAIAVKGDGEKAALFDRLRTHDFCFAAGPGWSPAEVFEHFRDEGLLQGAYRRIAWRSPGGARRRVLTSLFGQIRPVPQALGASRETSDEPS